MGGLVARWLDDSGEDATKAEHCMVRAGATWRRGRDRGRRQDRWGGGALDLEAELTDRGVAGLRSTRCRTGSAARWRALSVPASRAGASTGAQAAGLNRQVSARASPPARTSSSVTANSPPAYPTADGRSRMSWRTLFSPTPASPLHRLVRHLGPGEEGREGTGEAAQGREEDRDRAGRSSWRRARRAKLKADAPRAAPSATKLKSKISEESKGQGKIDGSALSRTHLTARFEDALNRRPTPLRADHDPGRRPGRCRRGLAYEVIWLDTPDKELRAVRPPRETASERLAGRSVRRAPTKASPTQPRRTAAARGRAGLRGMGGQDPSAHAGPPPLPYIRRVARRRKAWCGTRPGEAARAASGGQEASSGRRGRWPRSVRRTAPRPTPAVESLLREGREEGRIRRGQDSAPRSCPVYRREKITGRSARMRTTHAASEHLQGVRDLRPARRRCPGPIGDFASPSRSPSTRSPRGTSDPDNFVRQGHQRQRPPDLRHVAAAEGIGMVTGASSATSSPARTRRSRW